MFWIKYHCWKWWIGKFVITIVSTLGTLANWFSPQCWNTTWWVMSFLWEHVAEFHAGHHHLPNAEINISKPFLDGQKMSTTSIFHSFQGNVHIETWEELDKSLGSGYFLTNCPYYLYIYIYFFFFFMARLLQSRKKHGPKFEKPWDKTLGLFSFEGLKKARHCRWAFPWITYPTHRAHRHVAMSHPSDVATGSPVASGIPRQNLLGTSRCHATKSHGLMMFVTLNPTTFALIPSIYRWWLMMVIMMVNSG